MQDEAVSSSVCSSVGDNSHVAEPRDSRPSADMEQSGKDFEEVDSSGTEESDHLATTLLALDKLFDEPEEKHTKAGHHKGTKRKKWRAACSCKSETEEHDCAGTADSPDAGCCIPTLYSSCDDVNEEHKLSWLDAQFIKRRKKSQSARCRKFNKTRHQLRHRLSSLKKTLLQCPDFDMTDCDLGHKPLDHFARNCYMSLGEDCCIKICSFESIHKVISRWQDYGGNFRTDVMTQPSEDVMTQLSENVAKDDCQESNQSRSHRTVVWEVKKGKAWEKRSDEKENQNSQHRDIQQEDSCRTPLSAVENDSSLQRLLEAPNFPTIATNFSQKRHCSSSPDDMVYPAKRQQLNRGQNCEIDFDAKLMDTLAALNDTTVSSGPIPINKCPKNLQKAFVSHRKLQDKLEKLIACHKNVPFDPKEPVTYLTVKGIGRRISSTRKHFRSFHGKNGKSILANTPASCVRCPLQLFHNADLEINYSIPVGGTAIQENHLSPMVSNLRGVPCQSIHTIRGRYARARPKATDNAKAESNVLYRDTERHCVKPKKDNTCCTFTDKKDKAEIESPNCNENAGTESTELSDDCGGSSDLSSHVTTESSHTGALHSTQGSSLCETVASEDPSQPLDNGMSVQRYNEMHPECPDNSDNSDGDRESLCNMEVLSSRDSVPDRNEPEVSTAAVTSDGVTCETSEYPSDGKPVKRYASELEKILSEGNHVPVERGHASKIRVSLKTKLRQTPVSSDRDQRHIASINVPRHNPHQSPECPNCLPCQNEHGIGSECEKCNTENLPLLQESSTCSSKNSEPEQLNILSELTSVEVKNTEKCAPPPSTYNTSTSMQTPGVTCVIDETTVKHVSVDIYESLGSKSNLKDNIQNSSCPETRHAMSITEQGHPDAATPSETCLNHNILNNLPSLGEKIYQDRCDSEVSNREFRNNPDIRDTKESTDSNKHADISVPAETHPCQDSDDKSDVPHDQSHDILVVLSDETLAGNEEILGQSPSITSGYPDQDRFTMEPCDKEICVNAYGGVENCHKARGIDDSMFMYSSDALCKSAISANASAEGNYFQPNCYYNELEQTLAELDKTKKLCCLPKCTPLSPVHKTGASMQTPGTACIIDETSIQHVSVDIYESMSSESNLCHDLQNSPCQDTLRENSPKEQVNLNQTAPSDSCLNHNIPNNLTSPVEKVSTDRSDHEGSDIEFKSNHGDTEEQVDSIKHPDTSIHADTYPCQDSDDKSDVSHDQSYDILVVLSDETLVDNEEILRQSQSIMSGDPDQDELTMNPYDKEIQVNGDDREENCHETRGKNEGHGDSMSIHSDDTLRYSAIPADPSAEGKNFPSSCYYNELEQTLAELDKTKSITGHQGPMSTFCLDSPRFQLCSLSKVQKKYSCHSHQKNAGSMTAANHCMSDTENSIQAMANSPQDDVIPKCFYNELEENLAKLDIAKSHDGSKEDDLVPGTTVDQYSSALEQSWKTPNKALISPEDGQSLPAVAMSHVTDDTITHRSPVSPIPCTRPLPDSEGNGNMSYIYCDVGTQIHLNEQQEINQQSPLSHDYDGEFSTTDKALQHGGLRVDDPNKGPSRDENMADNMKEADKVILQDGEMDSCIDESLSFMKRKLFSYTNSVDTGLNVIEHRDVEAALSFPEPSGMDSTDDVVTDKDDISSSLEMDSYPCKLSSDDFERVGKTGMEIHLVSTKPQIEKRENREEDLVAKGNNVMFEKCKGNMPCMWTVGHVTDKGSSKACPCTRTSLPPHLLSLTNSLFESLLDKQTLPHESTGAVSMSEATSIISDTLSHVEDKSNETSISSSISDGLINKNTLSLKTPQGYKTHGTQTTSDSNSVNEEMFCHFDIQTQRSKFQTDKCEKRMTIKHQNANLVDHDYGLHVPSEHPHGSALPIQTKSNECITDENSPKSHTKMVECEDEDINQPNVLSSMGAPPVAAEVEQNKVVGNFEPDRHQVSCQTTGLLLTREESFAAHTNQLHDGSSPAGTVLVCSSCGEMPLLGVLPADRNSSRNGGAVSVIDRNVLQVPENNWPEASEELVLSSDEGIADPLQMMCLHCAFQRAIIQNLLSEPKRNCKKKASNTSSSSRGLQKQKKTTKSESTLKQKKKTKSGNAQSSSAQMTRHQETCAQFSCQTNSALVTSAESSVAQAKQKYGGRSTNRPRLVCRSCGEGTVLGALPADRSFGIGGTITATDGDVLQVPDNDCPEPSEELVLNSKGGTLYLLYTVCSKCATGQNPAYISKGKCKKRTSNASSTNRIPKKMRTDSGNTQKQIKGTKSGNAKSPSEPMTLHQKKCGLSTLDIVPDHNYAFPGVQKVVKMDHSYMKSGMRSYKQRKMCSQRVREFRKKENVEVVDCHLSTSTEECRHEVDPSSYSVEEHKASVLNENELFETEHQSDDTSEKFEENRDQHLMNKSPHQDHSTNKCSQTTESTISKKSNLDQFKADIVEYHIIQDILDALIDSLVLPSCWTCSLMRGW